MKIPDTLKIIGRDIKVVWDDTLVYQVDDTGQAQFRFDEIRLQKSNAGISRTPQSINITLLHEILHWVFFLMHEDKLNEDEPMIHRLSEVLYQVIKDNQLRF